MNRGAALFSKKDCPEIDNRFEQSKSNDFCMFFHRTLITVLWSIMSISRSNSNRDQIMSSVRKVPGWKPAFWCFCPVLSVSPPSRKSVPGMWPGRNGRRVKKAGNPSSQIATHHGASLATCSPTLVSNDKNRKSAILEVVHAVPPLN